MAPQVESTALGNRRDILAWLPDGWDAGTQPLKVVYMHDGQNLFGGPAGGGGFAGTWGVAEAMAQLADEGIAAMVVGVCHGKGMRIAELSPFKDRRHGGGLGPAYLDFLVDTVKPMVDDHFPTYLEARSTAMVGSSLAGLFSLWACVHRGDVFGLCGALSPSCWYGGRKIKQHLPASELQYMRVLGHRFYVDVGTREREPADDPAQGFHFGSWRYGVSVKRTVRQLRRGGFVDGENLRFVEDADAHHHEESWKRRLPDALRFLLTEGA